MTDALARIEQPRPVPYSVKRYEAFNLGTSTRLLEPLDATSLADALAETVTRWSWDRGDRLALRELGDDIDRLHIYAVRRKAAGRKVWDGFACSVEHDRWPELVCAVDLNVVAGIPAGAIGCEVQLHERRQAARPEGARLGRVAA